MHRDDTRSSTARGFGWGNAARAIRRTLAPLALVLAVLVVATPQISANIGWCKTDPIVAIGDEVVNIYVSAPEEILQSATGPTDVVVYVPAGTVTEVIFLDPGFGFGETVTVLESSRLHAKRKGIEVIVDVFVPASVSVPVLVEISPQSAGVVTASASGTTNGTVRLGTTV